MQRYPVVLFVMAFVVGGCLSDPYNQRWSRFLKTTDPKMTAWLDEEINIDMKSVGVPLGNMTTEGGQGRQSTALRGHLSLWILNRIPGLGFERQPIILRGRTAQGATIRVKDEAITRRELLYRFHREHGIIIDLVRIEGSICIRCRSKEYIDIMGG